MGTGMKLLAAAAMLAVCSAPVPAQPPDKVTFATNWVAQAEHGGFYQALADGTYRKYGLDVTIIPGGPNLNNRILLPVGRIDFFMSANSRLIVAGVTPSAYRLFLNATIVFGVTCSNLGLPKCAIRFVTMFTYRR